MRLEFQKKWQTLPRTIEILQQQALQEVEEVARSRRRARGETTPFEQLADITGKACALPCVGIQH